MVFRTIGTFVSVLLIARGEDGRTLTSFEAALDTKAILSRSITAADVDTLIARSLKYPDAVIPEVTRAIGNTPTNETSGKNRIRMLLEVIAYTGGVAAADAICRLAVADEALYGPWIARMLDYSTGRTDSFELAYEIFERGNESVKRRVAEWVVSFVDRSPIRLSSLAKQLMSRYAGTPTVGQLSTDPLVSRFPRRLVLTVNDRLEHLTSVDAPKDH